MYGFKNRKRKLKFPISLKMISRFKKQNLTYSFTVYGLEKPLSTLVGPLYYSKETRANHINLLLVQKGKNSLATQYVLIRDLAKMVTVKRYHNKRMVCNRCLNYFYSGTGVRISERVVLQHRVLVLRRLPANSRSFFALWVCSAREFRVLDRGG